MKTTDIGQGYLMISGVDAKKLVDGPLPEYGRERAVEYNGTRYWLGLTLHHGEAVWSLRERFDRSFLKPPRT